MLKSSITRYKLINEHINAVRAGRYFLAREILRLLRKRRTRVGLGDTAFELELIAAACGCRISYSRSYGSAEIRF